VAELSVGDGHGEGLLNRVGRLKVVTEKANRVYAAKWNDVIESDTENAS